MFRKHDIGEYIKSLINSRRMSHLVAYHGVLDGREGVMSETRKPLPKEVSRVVRHAGLKGLYKHQAEAIDMIRASKHVVVATPTASGKTLIYNLPVLERLLADHDCKALYLFPLKALARDQLKAFEKTTELLTGYRPTAAIYDGDTTAWHRKKIRLSPPNVLMSNPEMLHLSILPHHEKWAGLLKGLSMVVVDEVHTYRGVLGSHMAQVFRRLKRVCARYGSDPSFVFSSATIANPSELSGSLTDLDVEAVTESMAPRGKRHIVLLNPDTGPAQAAILLLKAALVRGLRTIVYTQSRKLTELIAVWAGSRAGEFKDRIAAYRAGFLPEERREIEAKLSNGELLAVISTSALELGIDIGDLDLCLLVGYPGSIMATLQRGGRVGRSGQESALVLVAGEDALDQYFMRHPAEFMHKTPESAVINPFNASILKKHLACAAAELPIKTDEPYVSDPAVAREISTLEHEGTLLRSAEGDRLFSRLKAPHRHVDLRGTGERFTIVCSLTGESRGEVDGFRAFKETHPGAVYLHQGTTFIVDTLDTATGTVKVTQADVDYYTKVRGHKHTEILDVFDRKAVHGSQVFMGRLKVTDQVSGYEKWRISVKKRLNILPLDLPPLIFETEGFWFTIPNQIRDAAESRYLHFMGGIHALEHAAIGMLPYFIMTDRNDLGGISMPFHPDIGSAVIFIYDSVPGGAGLSRQAFQHIERLLSQVHQSILSCPCESGCPGCVHSPKCGSGNRPIDKTCSAFILERLASGRRQFKIHANATALERSRGIPAEKEKANTSMDRYGVLDIETQRSAQEVGGWHRADLMCVSCAVLYDSTSDTYHEFLENQVSDLIEHLKQMDAIVGFNIKRFDYKVLSGYSDFNFHHLNTIDILERVHERLGYRLSLDHLATETLGIQKSADGLQALRWWKQGKIREIVDYCKVDVEITKDLFLFGRDNGFLLFKNKAGSRVRVPITF